MDLIKLLIGLFDLINDLIEAKLIPKVSMGLKLKEWIKFKDLFNFPIGFWGFNQGLNCTKIKFRRLIRINL